MNTRINKLMIFGAVLGFVSSASAQLPNPGLEFEPGRTAVVITDPQNDFLSPDGATWGVVGESVTANGTVENIETLLREAKANDIPVFVSPHYYYPTDHGWKFGGALEQLMHSIGMFDRESALSLEGFEGSGADWLELYKPYIEDGRTIITSPAQGLRARNQRSRIATAKTRYRQSHTGGNVRQSLYRVTSARATWSRDSRLAVVTDGTAAAIVEEGKGYEAAMINFRYLASATWTTDEVVELIQGGN